MVHTIRDRTPVTVVGREDERSTLTGRRFMGTLLHPVPRREMARQCGEDRAGLKITADWPCEDSCPVQAGQEVEIEGTRYRVCGVLERPGCYVDLYLAPA